MLEKLLCSDQNFTFKWFQQSMGWHWSSYCELTLLLEQALGGGLLWAHPAQHRREIMATECWGLNTSSGVEWVPSEQKSWNVSGVGVRICCQIFLPGTGAPGLWWNGIPEGWGTSPVPVLQPGAPSAGCSILFIGNLKNKYFTGSSCCKAVEETPSRNSGYSLLWHPRSWYLPSKLARQEVFLLFV